MGQACDFFLVRRLHHLRSYTIWSTCSITNKLLAYDVVHNNTCFCDIIFMITDLVHTTQVVWKTCHSLIRTENSCTTPFRPKTGGTYVRKNTFYFACPRFAGIEPCLKEPRYLNTVSQLFLLSYIPNSVETLLLLFPTKTTLARKHRGLSSDLQRNESKGLERGSTLFSYQLARALFHTEERKSLHTQTGLFLSLSSKFTVNFCKLFSAQAQLRCFLRVRKFHWSFT